MRKLLVLGGVAVIALIVGLWLVLANDDGAAAQTSSTTSPAPTGTSVGVPPPRGEPTVTTTERGERPELPATTSPEHPRDYVVGDIRVRDHRSGDNVPLDIPPNVHPPEGPKIPSTLTHAVAQQLKPIMMECVASLPKDARGDRPRLEGQLIIAIKDHKATVTKSTMQLRNVSGESVEPAKQCIESRAIGIEAQAADQADLDSYSINISFAIP
jgi:hypothetical protein